MPTPIRAHRPLPARTLASIVVVIGAFLTALHPGVATAQTPSAPSASWQFVPVSAPPPPTGTAPGPFAVPLGPVGQISFWAPNEGLLITGGTEGQNDPNPADGAIPSGGVVPAGVWAYDGVSWHELSSVCGGGDGRIAWAGPDEFWTIADQRPGEYEGSVPPYLTSISLCHFVDGQVVASYAMPTGQADSYEPMDAAACDGPDDCWFGGQDTNSSDPGAFQLHWDGVNLTATQEPEDHAVDDMTLYQGQILESVRLEPTDTYLPTENQAHPAVFHEIEGDTFQDVFSYSQSQGQLLPDYEGTAPDNLDGFALSTDAGTTQASLDSTSTSSCPSGTECPQLWAAANPEPRESSSGVSSQGTMTVLRHTGDGWTQVTPDPAGGSQCPASNPSGELPIEQLLPALESSAQVVPDSPLYSGVVIGVPAETTAPSSGTATGAIAAMPGTDDAWLSFDSEAQVPEVALIDPDGCVVQVDAPSDPGDTNTAPPDDSPFASVYQQAFTEAGENGTSSLPGPSTAVGASGAIDCPADNDCWMVTGDGWLYHYTDGTQLPQDTDPYLDGVITVRPPDAASQTIYGDVPPVDDSGSDDAPPYQAPPGNGKISGGKTTTLQVRLTDVKAKVVHRHVLELSFDLNIRARIQIIAQRHGKTVARSRRAVLTAGRHTVTLTLNPKRWPNHLKVDAKPEPTNSQPAPKKKKK